MRSPRTDTPRAGTRAFSKYYRTIFLPPSPRAELCAWQPANADVSIRIYRCLFSHRTFSYERSISSAIIARWYRASSFYGSIMYCLNIVMRIFLTSLYKRFSLQARRIISCNHCRIKRWLISSIFPITLDIVNLFISRTNANFFTDASTHVSVWTIAPFQEKPCAKN